MHDDGLPRVACKLAVRAPHSGGVSPLGRRVFPWDGGDPRPGGRLDRRVLPWDGDDPRPGDRHDRPRRRGLQYQVAYSSSAENSRFLKIDVRLAARAPIDDIRSFCPKAQLWRVHLPSSAVMPYHDSWNGSLASRWNSDSGSWAWRSNSDSDETEALKVQAAARDEKLDFLRGQITALTTMVN